MRNEWVQSSCFFSESSDSVTSLLRRAEFMCEYWVVLRADDCEIERHHAQPSANNSLLFSQNLLAPFLRTFKVARSVKSLLIVEMRNVVLCCGDLDLKAPCSGPNCGDESWHQSCNHQEKVPPSRNLPLRHQHQHNHNVRPL
jgi:hypothetical protein